MTGGRCLWFTAEKIGKATLELGEKERYDPLVMSSMGTRMEESKWLLTSIPVDHGFYVSKNILAFLRS